MVLCLMTPITTHQSGLSSAERARQLEESTARAMERYKTDFEAVRAKTSKLRAAREAREADGPAERPRMRKRAPAL